MRQISRLLNFGTASLVLLLAAESTLACRFEPDRRPLQQRLEGVPLAFVGKVLSSKDGTAVFAVEMVLRGSPGPTHKVPVQLSTCNIHFQPGDRWLFAGPTVVDPSLRIGDGSAPLATDFARLEDKHLGLDPAWQQCTSSSECAWLHYSCTATSARTDQLDKATQRAWARGGDPRAIECASSPSQRNAITACVSGRCDAWTLGVGVGAKR